MSEEARRGHQLLQLGAGVVSVARLLTWVPGLELASFARASCIPS